MAKRPPAPKTSAASADLAQSMLCARVPRDLALAVKAAAIDKQRQRRTPNTVGGIVEAAVRAWLKSEGY